MSPGARVAVGTLVLELGGTAEVIEVTAATAPIQAYSAERSYTVATQQVENLPVANRSFTALVELAPGVSGINRLGGGGFNNVMMDGISAMDTGNGAPVLLMNTESIAEVRVLVSNYQAEYGRSSRSARTRRWTMVALRTSFRRRRSLLPPVSAPGR